MEWKYDMKQVIKANELSFKGMPSSFFKMDKVPGDRRDPTGQQRVPTDE